MGRSAREHDLRVESVAFELRTDSVDEANESCAALYLLCIYTWAIVVLAALSFLVALVLAAFQLLLPLS